MPGTRIEELERQLKQALSLVSNLENRLEDIRRDGQSTAQRLERQYSTELDRSKRLIADMRRQVEESRQVPESRALGFPPIARPIRSDVRAESRPEPRVPPLPAEMPTGAIQPLEPEVTASEVPAPMWGEVDTPGEDVTEESPARSTGTPSFPMARGAMPRPKEHDLAQLRAQVEAPTELEFRAPTPAPMPPRVRPGAPPSPIPAGPSLGLDGYDEEEAPESEPVVAAVAVAPQGSGMPFGFRRETLLGVTAAVACLSAGGMLALALGISRGSIDLRPRDIAGETQALIAAPDPGEEIPDPGVPVAPSPEGAAAAQGAIPLPAALSAAASAPAPEPAAAPPRPDGVETSLPRRNTRSSGRAASGSAADPERAPAPAPASAAPASAAPGAAPAASGARRITPVAPADPAPAPQPGAVPWRNPKGDGPSRPADNGGRAAVLNELDY